MPKAQKAQKCCLLGKTICFFLEPDAAEIDYLILKGFSNWLLVSHKIIVPASAFVCVWEVGMGQGLAKENPMGKVTH